MIRPAYCLDTSILVKALVPEEGSTEAAALLRRIISGGYRLVAPSFAWAEVGAVLRKKVKAGLLSASEADVVWGRFLSLSIEYMNDEILLRAAWKIAASVSLPTLYDAAFLAAVEVCTQHSTGAIEFWTADGELVKGLGQHIPEYVRLLQHSG
ncbi:MAG: type II toxin-antitoxin system VapC family toxin [Ignavibacteriales bacterium]